MSSTSTDSLIALVQNHLGLLYSQTQQTEPQNVDGILTSTFLPAANIVLNHETVSFDKFKESISTEAALVSKADLTFGDVLDIPATDAQGLTRTGIVAGSFVVDQTEAVIIRDIHPHRLTKVAYSAKVIIPLVKDDIANAGAIVLDRRRISELFVTTVTQAVPIHIV